MGPTPKENMSCPPGPLSSSVATPPGLNLEKLYPEVIRPRLAQPQHATLYFKMQSERLLASGKMHKLDVRMAEAMELQHAPQKQKKIAYRFVD